MTCIVTLYPGQAGVRCMDAVTEFLTSATAPPELQAASINPAQWAVAGASKVNKLLSQHQWRHKH